MYWRSKVRSEGEMQENDYDSWEQVYQTFKARLCSDEVLFDTIEKHRIIGLRKDIEQLKNDMANSKPECKHLRGVDSTLGNVYETVADVPPPHAVYTFKHCPECGKEL